MAQSVGPLKTPAGVLVLSLFSFAAQAQSTPDAGSLLNQQQRTLPGGFERRPQPEGAPEAPALRRDAVGERVEIKAVRFQGAEGLAPEAELQEIARPVLGTRLAFSEMEDLADRVTRYLKQKGWLLARAYLPRQDLTEGVLTIVILQGRIESGAAGEGIGIKSGADLRLDPERIRKTIAAAVDKAEGQALSAGDVERAVLLLNDLPGVEARSYLEKGGTAGTARMGVEAKEGALFSGNAWLDNYGNRYTGSVRGNAVVNLNDPLGVGDQLSLLVTGAEGLKLGRLGYSLPLGYSGLRANAAVSALDYRIGKEQASLDSRGTAQTVSAGLSYPLLRSRDANLSISVNYEHKALQDKSLGEVTRDRHLDNVTVGITGDLYDRLGGGGINNMLLGVTQGRLDLGRNAADLANDRLTAQTQGSFTKFNYSAARLQKVTDELSLFLAFNGQQASKNLDSSEKFILGGPSAVRAYPTGEASGDSGWVANLEMRYDLPGLRSLGLGDVQVVGFYDTGRITLQKNPWSAAANASGSNSYGLSGVGLGVNLTKTGSYSIRMAWAKTLGGNPGRSVNGLDSDGKSNDQRVWLQALFTF